MDRQHEVEVFRSMLVQRGIVAPDGSEPELCDALCADDSAVVHFVLHHLSQPKTAEEVAIRSAYSAIERNNMFSKDLIILSLYAQYRHSCLMMRSVSCADKAVPYKITFNTFYRMDYQEMRELVAFSRSRATDAFCDLREQGWDRKVPALLRKKTDRKVH
jgi:hypothetical protein